MRTPVSAGTFRWIDSYSGDAIALTGPCTDVNESVTITTTVITTIPTTSPQMLLLPSLLLASFGMLALGMKRRG